MHTVLPRGRLAELSLVGTKVTDVIPPQFHGINHPQGNNQDLFPQKSNTGFTVLPGIRIAPLSRERRNEGYIGHKYSHRHGSGARMGFSHRTGSIESNVIRTPDPQKVSGDTCDPTEIEDNIDLSGDESESGMRTNTPTTMATTPRTSQDNMEKTREKEDSKTETATISTSCADFDSSPKPSKKEKKRRKRKQSKHSKRSKSSLKPSSRQKSLKSVPKASAEIINTSVVSETMGPLQSHSIQVLPSSKRQNIPKPRIIYPEMLKAATDITSPRISTKARSNTKNSSLSNSLRDLEMFSAYTNISKQNIMRTQTMDILHMYANQGTPNNSITANISKPTKVYLSEKQSRNQKELGQEYPCPPPATPMPVLTEHLEFVPCMSDIKSQRAVKMRLEAINKVEKKRLEKLRQDKQTKEKERMKEEDLDLRKQQRLEIYALNKVMSELEHANFLSFCETHGLKNSQ